MLPVLVACLLSVGAAHAAGPSGQSRPPTTAGGPQPGPQPARTIVVPNIAVNEALLDRLSSGPVPLPGNLSPAQRSGLDDVARKFKAGNMEAARDQWGKVLGSYLTGGSNTGNAGNDIMQMLYYVFKQSIEDSNEDKNYYLKKVQAHNALAEALSAHRKELSKASQELAKQETTGRAPVQGRAAAATIEVRTVTGFPPRSQPIPDNTLRWTSRKMDRNALDAYIRSVETQHKAARDDAELASIQMQNIVQKRQQALQLLSNISKQMSDTATGVIQNIK